MQLPLFLQKLQGLDSNTKKGSLFEKICQHLLKERDTSGEYKNIYLWQEWDKRDGADTGIDLIIETKDQNYIAVQCKFHAQPLDLKTLSTFFTKLQSGVGEVRFQKGIIITTTTLNSNAKNACEQISQTLPIDLITGEDFASSSIDWDALEPTSSELPLSAKKTPREHQKQAISNSKEYFKTHSRGKLIMACGTGKTFTSLKILESITKKTSTILFLAPSIALVSQTFREYIRERSDDFYACIVCSDSKSGKSKAQDEFTELPTAASTDIEDIRTSYQKAKLENKRFIIFATYQSSMRIGQAQQAGYLDAIDLMICDEAHRSVGAMHSATKELNTFTLCHHDSNIQAHKRLYMTATPKIYTEASKQKARENQNEVFCMDDEEIFGQEIYKIDFKDAIEKDLLTDYKVLILAMRKDAMAGITNNAIKCLKDAKEPINDKLIDTAFVSKIIGTHKGLARKDLIAIDDAGELDQDFITQLDENPSKRAITFCRDIATSKSLEKSFNTIMQSYDAELASQSFKNLQLDIHHIDGTMNALQRLEKINILNTTTTPPPPAREPRI